MNKLLGSVMGAASALAVAFGVGYLIDCRMNGGDVDKCWLTGGSLAGIGTAGQASYRAGFWRPNPAISNQERSRVAPIDTPKA